MNFCKDCDEYISLYLDELLDDETKSDFLEHMEQCSQCSAKFEDALFCAELCKEEQEIPLPENFSETLHIRLQQVSESTNKNNTREKLAFIIKSKRLIASLSTAAVLVISLLAYNLMPSMVTKDQSTANYSETAQMEMSKMAEDTDNSGDISVNSEEEKSIQAKANGENNISSTNDTKEAAAGGPSEDAKIKITFSEPATADKKEDTIADNSFKMRTFEDRENTESGSKDVLLENDTLQYSILGNNLDTKEYISNYSEIKMEVSAEGTEIEKLKLLMNDVGASELHIFADNNIVEDSNMIFAGSPDKDNSNVSTNEIAEAFVTDPEYIDYYLTLNQYSLLEAKAAKYHLEFNSKTDIIKKDVTHIYNEINKKQEEIDNKITNASKNNEDVSVYQAEKERLTEELNKITNEKEIVVLRIYLVY
ncbi:zf-HC2 domain-containing protein [Ruminiclostridium herbifermentans]|uniref:Zf-HC2 domain-containing protein n=1 Tax=Ruminiclostridium herbifermentans TaxID=2488810 RepID=A0A4U7JJJ0_9FIRM|nr:zf-HC2 domain-containing protein [Ruminiclostridium herbifermentans]QNU68362.1 zf-HC2 domain-containing protein [Ruminiclostridium herbifermentans]